MFAPEDTVADVAAAALAEHKERWSKMDPSNKSLYMVMATTMIMLEENGDGWPAMPPPALHIIASMVKSGICTMLATDPTIAGKKFKDLVE